MLQSDCDLGYVFALVDMMMTEISPAIWPKTGTQNLKHRQTVIERWFKRFPGFRPHSCSMMVIEHGHVRLAWREIEEEEWMHIVQTLKQAHTPTRSSRLVV